MNYKRFFVNFLLNIQLSVNYTESFTNHLDSNNLLITVGLVLRLSNDYQELFIYVKGTF
jgi:hypothetical protein